MKFYGSEERQKDLDYINSLDVSKLKEEPFEMPISSCEISMNRGCVLEGYISSGMFKVGDSLNIMTKDGLKPFVINEINLVWVPCVHRRRNGYAYKGEKVGLLVRGLNESDVVLDSVVKSI